MTFEQLDAADRALSRALTKWQKARRRRAAQPMTAPDSEIRAAILDITAEKRRALADVVAGIAWWNRLTHRERAEWLLSARDRRLPESVAGAWDAYKAYELELAAAEPRLTR